MELPPSFDDGRPAFDQVFADALVGKRVLVGITYETPEGEFKRQGQYHGVVSAVDPRVGITVDLQGVHEGRQLTLPPATEPWEPARKGTYTLRSTGEEIVDPDFTTSWRIAEPDA